MDAKQHPVLFLMGPTASGKTDLAAYLYDHLDCELISVDSVQVYRGMDVGSAKPDAEFLARYPHHLINIREIHQTYSAAEFCSDATRLIDAAIARNRLPVLVGGTMFYFAALQGGLSPLPAADANVRAQITARIEQYGLDALYRDLVTADPKIANRIQATDRQRVERATEILMITGRPPTEVQRGYEHTGIARSIVKFALVPGNRQVLHKRIVERFDQMLDQGLIDEVQSILNRYENPLELPAMRSVGYRQVAGHLTAEKSLASVNEAAAAATRQLAKRQLTWLRNQSGVTWLDTLNARTRDALMTCLGADYRIRDFLKAV